MTVKTTRRSRRTAETEKSESAFKTISEVAELLDVPAHVLRFWEQKFSHITPLKRRGGRRYYRPEDVENIREVKRLLYDEGYTIKGAARHFGQQRRQGKKAAIDSPQLAQSAPKAPTAANDAQPTPEGDNVTPLSSRQRAALEETLDELKEMKELLQKQA